MDTRTSLLSLLTLSMPNTEQAMFIIDQTAQVAYLVRDRICLLGQTCVLFAYGRFLSDRGLFTTPGLGARWCIALLLYLIHHGIVCLSPTRYNHKMRSRFMFGNTLFRLLYPFLRYKGAQRLRMQQLIDLTAFSSSVKAFLVLALGEPWLNMCTNLVAMLSFKHQLVFSALRALFDMVVIVPTLSSVINRSPEVAEISSQACPWVHSVASCTTPWFLFHPQEAVCPKAHATYNLVAITITVGHLVPLLVCYWHELQVKLQFLATRTGGDPEHPGLPHPNSMPLVLTLQLTAGLAVASLLATQLAMASG